MIDFKQAASVVKKLTTVSMSLVAMAITPAEADDRLLKPDLKLKNKEPQTNVRSGPIEQQGNRQILQKRLEGELNQLKASEVQVKADLAKVEADVSRLSGVAKSEPSNLRAYADKRAKLTELLSNIMKKISDTSAAITANMK